MFVDLMDSRAETTGKRFPESFGDKVCVLIFNPLNKVRSMFLDLLDSRGEDPW